MSRESASSWVPEYFYHYASTFKLHSFFVLFFVTLTHNHNQSGYIWTESEGVREGIIRDMHKNWRGGSEKGYSCIRSEAKRKSRTYILQTSTKNKIRNRKEVCVHGRKFMRQNWMSRSEVSGWIAEYNKTCTHTWLGWWWWLMMSAYLNIAPPPPPPSSWHFLGENETKGNSQITLAYT